MQRYVRAFPLLHRLVIGKKSNLFTWKPIPYRPVNTLRLGYKNQPVNAV
jgi:hypothetical protein